MEFFRLLVPVVAIAYAIVSVIVDAIENWTIKALTQISQNATDRIKAFETGIKMISFVEKLPIKDKKPPPPRTNRRKRPMKDSVEWVKYWMDRITRVFSFFQA